MVEVFIGDPTDTVVTWAAGTAKSFSWTTHINANPASTINFYLWNTSANNGIQMLPVALTIGAYQAQAHLSPLVFMRFALVGDDWRLAAKITSIAGGVGLYLSKQSISITGKL